MRLNVKEVSVGAAFATNSNLVSDICHMYELHLKEDNPGLTTITYDISQLFDYIDKITDLSCLV